MSRYRRLVPRDTPATTLISDITRTEIDRQQTQKETDRQQQTHRKTDRQQQTQGDRKEGRQTGSRHTRRQKNRHIQRETVKLTERR